MRITARDIQDRINRDLFSGSNTFFNNVCLHKWAECDILKITKGMVIHEIEIKISRSDWKADYKKTICNGYYYIPNENKHDLLLNGFEHAPTKFSFACPTDLIKPNEINEKYGLYYYNERGYMDTVRRPKPLNKNRFDESRLNKELSKFWHKTIWERYYGEAHRENLKAEREDKKYDKELLERLTQNSKQPVDKTKVNEILNSHITEPEIR